MADHNFWSNKKVFVTGHTGFKGSWLTLWLSSMGARVAGYSLAPDSTPNLFEICSLETRLEQHTLADITDGQALYSAMDRFQPEIVIHMAAQPLVRESYKSPAATYATNVMGTVNLFEAVRQCSSVKAVVNVTTDKCYENKEWAWGYRENESLGGYDPYSSSKACSELVTASYRNSFFQNPNPDDSFTAVATARAGNVIGGGDWSADRLIPDCIRALSEGQKVPVRSPHSIRPWQHVLEPLSGYLLLAQRLYENKQEFAQAWNFGPNDSDAKPVQWIVETLCKKWSDQAGYEILNAEQPHEAKYLKLDCSKAKTELNWTPKWNLEYALDKIIEFTSAYHDGKNVTELCLQQIEEYESPSGGTQHETF
ncbi:CDP-glucose 4,6-dehydratase [Saccharibacillus sp. O16]|nr:CDP-glucose 4,6-dehydratase [Saccharibacillus sp. O16]